MTEAAFFRVEGDRYVPLEGSRGYWRHNSLHGRSLVGLIGAEMERRHGQPGMVPARFNVDMFRLAPFAPLEIETRVLRKGSRLQLVEATLIAGGNAYARAQCQFLRRANVEPEGQIWSPAPWDVPPPGELPEGKGYKRNSMFEFLPIEGDLNTYGPRKIWVREFAELIEGVALTPWTRLALIADFASPWLNGTEKGVHFINTDAVLHAHRMPIGEWIGVETTGREASGGIAVGHCRIYDEAGPLGHVSCTALTNTRSEQSPDLLRLK